MPDDDLAADMMLLAHRTLESAGYGHYEVSSYALPGHRARHNSGYWSMKPYLALGAGAHGFEPPVRTMNDPNIGRYMERASRERPTVTTERLDPETLAWERLMTGLRDLERGVPLEVVPDASRPAVEREVDMGRLEVVGQAIRLTVSGWMGMDDVLLNLSP